MAQSEALLPPKVLVIGGTTEEHTTLSALSGWLHVISPNEELKFNERDFDLAIVFESALTDGLRVPYRIVLSTTAEDSDVVSRVRGSGSQNVFGPPLLFASRPPVLALQFTVSDMGKQFQSRSEAMSTLIPELGTPYKVFDPKPSDTRDQIYPLLSESGAGNLVLAGIVKSAGTTTVFLPTKARDSLRAWLQASFDYFRTIDESRFPGPSSSNNSTWATAAELRALSALKKFDAVESARRDEVSKAREALEEAKDNAELESAPMRVLLHGTGDELVQACADLFLELGFQVKDSDSLPQHKAAKQEDLRVFINGLVILAEIKGYAKGAKSNDLEQLKKAGTVYATVENSEPDRLWYIVNAYRDAGPNDRPQVLESSAEQLDAFARLFSGVVFDTRDLYRLIRDVQLGLLTCGDAQALLMSAQGRFEYVSDAGGHGE
ncbi:hypothetical protein [Clavibacter lycopersici]|uniref:hypothetical protein n=1 Tax=Clavibacter lycopersici TaxID=2301718 RepID=UPI0011C2139D|nr:hypothetical protein [Clavibacter lycopersici]